MQSLLQSTSWLGLEGWGCWPPCHWHMHKWPPSHPWPWWRPTPYIRRGRAITPLTPLYAGHIQGGGQAGKISSCRLVAGWRQCQWTGWNLTWDRPLWSRPLLWSVDGQRPPD
jgi:hypothetical protein